MTDLEKFLELYKSVGIDLTPMGYGYEDGVCIHLETYITNKIDGYTCFFTDIVFDKDEKFIKQVIGE